MQQNINWDVTLFSNVFFLSRNYNYQLQQIQQNNTDSPGTDVVSL